MQDMLINFVEQFGYIGIALLICVENVFPPIPSEVILVFGGFLTTQTDMNPWLVILFATIGSTLGAGILYALGWLLQKERIQKILSGKLGKILHLKPEDVEKADKWFCKYEYKAVLICRCIPVVRSLISIPAGMSKMKPLPFFALTILGSTVWNTVLVWIGALTGDAWQSSLKYIGWYTNVFIVILGICAVGAIFFIYKKKKKRANTMIEEKPITQENE